MSTENYRLYSFVAGNYLNELQKGLQTAHVVGNLAVKYHKEDHQNNAFRTWAAEDKTIIILNAVNHQGVLDCMTELRRTGITPGFVGGAVFFEDEQSMNSMATACGVIVPQKYWDAVPLKHEDGEVWAWEYTDENSNVTKYLSSHPEGQFVNHIKKYRLA